MDMAKDMVKGIDDALNCSRACTETLSHCIEMGEDHADPMHIEIMMDCAKICEVTANFMMRDSEYHLDLCTLCADICDDCAESCESFDEQFMKDCAVACRQCAKSCRKMVEKAAEMEE